MTSIKKQIVSGSIYNGLAKYLTMFCNIVVTAVLARIIPPSDFGIVALTTVVVSFFDLFSDIGLGPAIIQSKDIGKGDFPHIFTYSGLFALALAVIFWTISTPISRFYDEPRLIPLLRLLSFHLFFNTFCILPRALMLKKKRFKQISIVSVSNVIVWGAVSVVAAKMGLGIYSLLITPIGLSLCSFVLYLILCQEKIKLVFRPSFSSVRKLLSFSLFQFGFNCINFFSRNLDKLLIGKKLGMTPLGYYEKSYRMMTLPLSSLTQVFAPTIQPILSEYETQKSVISNVYYSLSRYLMAIGSVLSPILFFCSKELILIVFGEQWIGAVPVFQILSLSVLFQLLDSMSGAFLQASNAPKYLFISGLICAILNMSFLVFSLIFYKDIRHIALFVSIALSLNLWVSVYYIVIKVFDKAVSSYLRLFVMPLAAIIIVSCVLWGASFFCEGIPCVVSFSIKLLVSVSVGYIFYRKSNYIDISLNFVKSLK